MAISFRQWSIFVKQETIQALDCPGDTILVGDRPLTQRRISGMPFAIQQVYCSEYHLVAVGEEVVVLVAQGGLLWAGLMVLRVQGVL